VKSAVGKFGNDKLVMINSATYDYHLVGRLIDDKQKDEEDSLLGVA
jgi:hypothetical protein